MTTKKDPPNNEGSGPAHMSGNSYGSIIPQAPPIQVGEGGGLASAMTPTARFNQFDTLPEQPYHVYEGTRIKFLNEYQAYTVRCNSERYTICTKPFNAQKTVLYTIIDWKEQRRGPEDLVFGAGAETDKECLEMLVRLLDGRDGRSSVSRRHEAPLNRIYGIEWIKNGKEVVWQLNADYKVTDLLATDSKPSTGTANAPKALKHIEELE